VRGAAIWALGRLLGRERLAALAPALADADPDVVEEWRASLSDTD
jgi:epoxyqueuosine reductase